MGRALLPRLFAPLLSFSLSTHAYCSDPTSNVVWLVGMRNVAAT